MDGVNEQTEHEIDGVMDLMVALKSVSDVGKRVIDEVAAFADTVLRLAEVQDEMAVAVNDMKRAVEEESIVNKINFLFISKNKKILKNELWIIVTYSFLSKCMFFYDLFCHMSNNKKKIQ